MEPDAAGLPLAPEEFSPERYWEARLADTWGFSGVGLMGHGRGFNAILYRVRRAVFLAEVKGLPHEVKGLDVLDVGSGAGFYVDLWRELGAGSVAGTDLTEVAVRNLRRTRPGVAFTKLDIGALGIPYEPGTFDIVSAFDVFFHIVDDERFAQALRNIASVLKPGGCLIFSDALLARSDRGNQAVRPAHVKWRSEREVRRLLENEGFVLGGTRPVFVLLNPPIDSTRASLRRIWSLISRAAVRSEVTGTAAGMVLYPIERLLLRFTGWAPTTKMLSARLGAS